jgi:hypothetical protein
VFSELVEARPQEEGSPTGGEEDSDDTGDTCAVTLRRRSVAMTAAALV